MLWSWVAIVLVNWLWLLHLWHRRRRDHPLLVPFFAVYVFSDTLGFLISSPAVGGLDLIPLQRLLRPVWVSCAAAIWMSWYIAPLIVAIRLDRERVGWKAWVAVAGPAVLIAASEHFGTSIYQRRVMMHWVFEPVVLALALALIARYSWRQVRRGEAVDFIAFAAGLTAAMLGLKVLLLLTSEFRYQALPARVFFLVFMVFVVAVYHLTPRVRAWLLLNS
jgi:hypothetical protein